MRSFIQWIAFSALMSVGCTHTYYQFRVGASERDAIDQTKDALAAASSDQDGLAQVVDLDGRRAVETLVAGMTIEGTEADPQYARLVRALYLGIMGDVDDPLTALDQEITWIAARVAQRVATTGLSQSGLGQVAALVGLPGDSDAERLTEMSASLVRGRIGTCQTGDVIVSYNAGILGHINSRLAENDAIYVAWRQRVQAMHLARFTCATRHVIILMSQNRGEAGMRVLGWHFLTQEQWDRLNPRLHEALDL